MFTSRDYSEHIMSVALEDLRDFFHHDILDSMDSYNARKEANSIDPMFTLNQEEDIADFTGRLLDWLEQRKFVHQAPWVNGNGEVRLEGHCRHYLAFLEYWCVSISGSMIEKSEVQPEIRIQRLLRFATYVANNKLTSGSWRFTFTPADPKLLSGYVSFLIVDAENRNLFVCYDNERFERIGKNIVVMSALKQKAILHGLGLARTTLDWYLHIPVNAKQVITPPSYEADACMYEYAIKALIATARTRIRYLLGKGNNEWTEI